MRVRNPSTVAAVLLAWQNEKESGKVNQPGAKAPFLLH